MDEGTSLDSILDDAPEGTVEAKTVEAAPETAEQPQEAPEGPLRGPDGKFIPKAETGVEPEETQEAVPPTDKLPKEDYKAIREEREKRQKLEAELEALKAQFQQQPKEPPPPPPSMWEDEQGWQQHLQQQFLQQADQLSRINASEMAARAQNPDFQEMFDLFNEMAVQNPSVVQQAMQDPHPWGKAYQIAKSHKSMQELGAVDVADLEAKLREKIMAEMQTAQVPVQRPSVPPSLTGERNVGSRTGPAWAGPKPLTDLLG